jgi:hypothetical protein
VGIVNKITLNGEDYTCKLCDTGVAFKIESDSLFKEFGHYEDVPEEERLASIKEQGLENSPFSDVIGSIMWVHEGWTQIDAHCIFKIYNDEEILKLKFTDNKLVSCEKIKEE